MPTQEDGELAPTNREIGSIWMARILGRLYDEWPVGSALSVHEIDPTSASSDENEQIESSDEQDAMWEGLINWLVREGIIHVGVRSIAGYLDDVQLTARGFAHLQQALPGTPSTSTVDRLKVLGQQAATEGGKAGAKAVINDIVELMGTFIGNLAKPFLS